MSHHLWILLVSLAAALTIVAGCAELELGCDDLAGMLQGPGGLTVTEDEHPTGWGQDRCFTCHSVEVTHVQNCTELDEVDLAAIRDRVEDDGLESCAECHGTNGLDP